MDGNVELKVEVLSAVWSRLPMTDETMARLQSNQHYRTDKKSMFDAQSSG